jgi:hypothetical protein
MIPLFILLSLNVVPVLASPYSPIDRKEEQTTHGEARESTQSLEGSAKEPTSRGDVHPKISPAEMWARLLDQPFHASIEPTPIPK